MKRRWLYVTLHIVGSLESWTTVYTPSTRTYASRRDAIRSGNDLGLTVAASR